MIINYWKHNKGVLKLRLPVCKISSYNNIVGTIFYDTSSNRFIDDKVRIQRILPVQDFASCITMTNNLCTVVGKDYSTGNYIVCFGDNFLYSLDKESLYKYRLTNIKICKDNRFRCIDGKLEDLSYLFPDKKIEFLDEKSSIQESSLGVARKFVAKYNNKLCVVKFSKLRNNMDLINEIKYYKLAQILGVSCCKVHLSKYFGKMCCISEFRYNINKDVFNSFKVLGGNPMKIYQNLSSKDKMKFDKLMVLDYIVEQQDRHMSNIALCNDKLYPSFDNGECLRVGSVGYFSSNFRTYVERLDSEYIKGLFRSIDINRIKGVLSNNEEYDLVVNNMKRLGLV